MSVQNDMVIANGTGAAVRADINSAIQALANNSSGSSAPSTNYVSQFFANTSSGIMQINNTSGNAFINLFTLAGGPAFPIDGTINSINIGKGANSVAGNTVLGESALDAAVTGGNNVAIGKSALTDCTSGSNSVAVGSSALQKTTTGASNVAIGLEALQENTTGSSNVAAGQEALENNTTASNNTAIGKGALEACTTGGTNSSLGAQAGDVITTGTNNTSLGYQADPSSATATNEVTLGNSSVSAIRCQVQTISSLSDERDKTDIVDSEDGLDIINALRPRKFTWAMREPSDNDGKTELGFIAQEIDAALGDKNDYIGAVYKLNPDRLEASYGKLIPILVKAIQELSAKVTALEAG